MISISFVTDLYLFFSTIQKRDYSAPLTAAFLFADSLTHGAYGHAPIDLDVVSYNTLIKACCYRGAIWRALNIINEVMPQKGIEPDTYSYNVIMHGLARMVRQIHFPTRIYTFALWKITYSASFEILFLVPF